MGLGEQGVAVLHADERLLVEPDRVPVHHAVGVRLGQLGLPHARGTPGGDRVLRPMAERRAPADQAELARAQTSTPIKDLTPRETRRLVTALENRVFVNEETP